MTAQATTHVNIGHYARIPSDTIFEDMRPRARQIFNHLALFCSPENPFVYVNQRGIAGEMYVHQETVGKWVRHLEKTGRLVFTGAWETGGYKIYKMIYLRDPNNPNAAAQKRKARRKTWAKKIRKLAKAPKTIAVPKLAPEAVKAPEPTQPPAVVTAPEIPEEVLEASNSAASSTSSDFAGSPPVVSLDPGQRFRGTYNKETINQNIQQPAMPAAEQPKPPVNNQIGAPVAKQMESIGVSAPVVGNLVKEFGPEACETQVEHLEFLQGKSSNIKDGARWLVSAIKRAFTPPDDLKAKKREEKQRKQQKILKAMEEKIRTHFDNDNYEATISLANKRLAYGLHLETKELLLKAKQRIKRLRDLKEAEKSVSSDVKQTLSEQAWAEIKKNPLVRGESVESLKKRPIWRGAAQHRYEDLLVKAWKEGSDQDSFASTKEVFRT